MVEISHAKDEERRFFFSFSYPVSSVLFVLFFDVLLKVKKKRFIEDSLAQKFDQLGVFWHFSVY